MEPKILCTLLANEISPSKFQVHGLDVVFLNQADNTPENQAIIANVNANYETLAAARTAGKTILCASSWANGVPNVTDYDGKQITDSNGVCKVQYLSAGAYQYVPHVHR